MIFSEIIMVPKEGVEPSRGVTPRDFESRASAYSATSAQYSYQNLYGLLFQRQNHDSIFHEC